MNNFIKFNFPINIGSLYIYINIHFHSSYEYFEPNVQSVKELLSELNF